jgi:hypothetical protein
MDSNRKLHEHRSVKTGRYKKGKIGTWKEFMNDRLLSKKYKKQLPCD